MGQDTTKLVLGRNLSRPRQRMHAIAGGATDRESWLPFSRLSLLGIQEFGPCLVEGRAIRRLKRLGMKKSRI